MANGPQIVPAPIQPRPSSGFIPAGPKKPGIAERIGMMRPSGRRILAARDAKEDRAQNRQAHIKQMLMQMLQGDPSVDLRNISASFPDMDVSTWHFLTEMQKRLKTQQKNKEAEGAIAKVPSLIAAGELGPAQKIIQQHANLTRDPQKPFEISGEAQRQSQLNALNLPLAGVAQRQTIAADVAAESKEARGERRRLQIEREKGMVRAGAMAMAGGTGHPDALRRQWIKMGISPHRTFQMVEEARLLAQGEKVALGMQAGQTPEIASRDALFAQMQEESEPNGGIIVASNGKQRKLELRDAINVENGSLVDIQVNGVTYLIRATDKSDAKKVRQEMGAARSIGSMINDVEESYRKVSAGVASGEITSVGAGLPTSLQTLARFIGQQHPDVATYQTRSFMTISFVLKAIQGSRPSDFDFKNFLAIMPSMQEFNSESGIARISALRLLIERNQLARVSGSALNTMMKMKGRMRQSSTHRKEDAAVDKAVAHYKTMLDRAERGEISNEQLMEETGRLMDAGQKWRNAGASGNWIPPGSTGSQGTLSPASEALLDGI